MRRLLISGLCGLVTVAGVAIAATSVQAFDLTGTWEGTYTCKGSNVGEKDSYQDVLVAQITQTGTGVGLAITFTGAPFKYNGIAVANAAKPDKGDLVVTLCGTDDDLSTGAYDELGRLSVVTKPAKGTGSIKGVSSFSTPAPSTYTCKWKLKRTNPANPAVAIACQ